MGAFNIKFPTLNQLVSMAIAIAILFFIVKLLPESVRSWFRV